MRALRYALIAAAISMAAPANSADLVSVMSRYEGLHERSNRNTLRKMLGVNPVSTPWCGAFMTFAVKKIGRKPPAGSFKASSWSRYGKAVKRSQARRGDVAVVRGGRHVIAVTGRKGAKLCGWSGNASNMIKHACFGGVVSVRR